MYSKLFPELLGEHMSIGTDFSLFSADLAYTILDNVPQCMSCWSDNFENIYCNKAFLQFFDMPDTKAFQTQLEKLYPKRQPNRKFSSDALRDYMRIALVEGHAQGPFVFSKTNSRENITQLTFTRIDKETTQGKKYYLLCTLTATPSVKFAPTISPQTESDALAREIMHTSLLGSTLWNANLEILDCTNKRLEVFGVSKEEFISTFYSFCPPLQPDGSPSYETLRGHLQTALDIGYCAFTWTFVDKKSIPFFLKIVLIRIELQGQQYILSYTSDKNMSELPILNIINNYDRMQLLLKYLPMGVDLWNKDFQLFDCNEATLHLFGAKSKEDYITNFKSFTPEFQPDGRRSEELIAMYLEEVFENGSTYFEWLHIDAQGRELPVEISIVRTSVGEEDIAVVYYKDLRLIKENSRQTEQRLKDINAILDSAPYAINTWDKNFRPVDCNLATLDLYGFTSKEDYFENFHKVMPEKQKDGRIMVEVFGQRFMEAFTRGYSYDEGELYNIKTQKLFPVEITLKKLHIHDEDVIISYLNDVTMQKNMMAEIEKSRHELSLARDVAEKSSHVKSEFLANMSHEIRTPMNGILGLVHLLNHTELQEQQKSYVDKILFSAESLLRIINDILDFSKIEAGKMEMEHISFSLADIQEELRTLFAPKFIEKKIRGEIFTDNVLDTLLVGDPLRLKQVLLNLLSNAVKFTDSGRISVSINNVDYVSPTHIRYQFCVEDTGIGLSEEQCQRLFEAFTQADTSTTRKYGGTGLGLVISRRIVEMMQGKIWIESEIGQGSRFHFTAVFELDNGTSQKEKELQTTSLPNKLALTGNILLVEDNEINQLIAVELITSQGHSVDVAHNGQEAVDMIDISDYDMVFMDIQMPVMDGLAATRKIRENERFAKLPIIAMSAHAMKGDREISLSHGMNDHITKPIDPPLLYKTIETWLSIPKAQR